MKRKGIFTLAVILAIAVGLILVSWASAADEEPVPVVVEAGEEQSGSPGETLILKAEVEIADGSVVTGYEWTQTAGVAATIADANAQSATVILADQAAYKTGLFKHLKVLDRFMV